MTFPVAVDGATVAEIVAGLPKRSGFGFMVTETVLVWARKEMPVVNTSNESRNELNFMKRGERSNRYSDITMFWLYAASSVQEIEFSLALFNVGFL